MLHQNKKTNRGSSFYLSKTEGLGMASIRAANCMELRLVRVWHQAIACISSSSVLIPYSPLARFHTATGCGFHSRLCRDLVRRGVKMKRNLLLEYSEELAIKIAKLCSEYKIDSNTVFQIKKSSSSVFANITEAQYPQSLADMHSKFEIARKKCAETESWLKLIFASGTIDEQIFKNHRNLCGRIKRMLTASCITIENKLKQG